MWLTPTDAGHDHYWLDNNCQVSNGRGLRPSITFTLLYNAIMWPLTWSSWSRPPVSWPPFAIALWKRNETCRILMPNELRNAERFTFNSTIRPKKCLQWNRWSIIHHAKHIIGLHSVVLCTIWAFWTVADNVTQQIDYIEHPYFAVIYVII